MKKNKKNNNIKKLAINFSIIGAVTTLVLSGLVFAGTVTWPFVGYFALGWFVGLPVAALALSAMSFGAKSGAAKTTTLFKKAFSKSIQKSKIKKLDLQNIRESIYQIGNKKKHLQAIEQKVNFFKSQLEDDSLKPSKLKDITKNYNSAVNIYNLASYEYNILVENVKNSPYNKRRLSDFTKNALKENFLTKEDLVPYSLKPLVLEETLAKKESRKPVEKKQTKGKYLESSKAEKTFE